MIVGSFHRHRLLWLLATATAVLASGAIVAALRDSTRTNARTDGPSAPPPTEIVKRRILETRISVDGLLGYADPRQIVSHLRGTVTAAQPTGTVVQPGQSLYRVDDRPVVLLDGAIPAWRTLSPGVSPGSDVSQLKRNLVEMGMGPIEVSGVFDTATEHAVKRWQQRAGMKATGTLGFGTVVFEPGARRISTAATIGSSVSRGAIALRTSSTARQVMISVSPEQRQYLRAGAHIEVSLPGGRSVIGLIAAVDRTAVAHKDGPPTVGATISVPARAVPDLDAAPVTVAIVTEQARRVTSVSIEALLALQGGGFGLEVIGHGQRRIVPVRLGAAADGFVACRGMAWSLGPASSPPADDTRSLTRKRQQELPRLRRGPSRHHPDDRRA